MSVPSARLQEEQLRLLRAREQAEARERLARLNAEAAREHQRREQEARRRQQEHELRLERERLRAAGGPTHFTPPQSFIAGYAASRIPGAPALLDVAIAVGTAAVATAWVATRDHSTGGDLGWSAFLLGLGIVLAVEAHAEAHDAGVGLLGSQAGYMVNRLIGGSVQPGSSA